jgi:hypothetical protein
VAKHNIPDAKVSGGQQLPSSSLSMDFAKGFQGESLHACTKAGVQHLSHGVSYRILLQDFRILCLVSRNCCDRHKKKFTISTVSFVLPVKDEYGHK